MESADPGFETIRTTLQSALTMPMTVVVTSSCVGDGKTEIAVGTAVAFAQAGFPTLVIDANPHSPMVTSELGIAPVAPAAALDPFPEAVKTTRLPDVISLAAFSRVDEVTLGELRVFMAEIKKRYSVAIIDTSELGDASFPTAACAAADGVVLAVRHGRWRHDEDRRLIATIEGAGGSVIGTIGTHFRSKT
jgi:Mrp family chromosome partitioning ATPase